MNTPSLASRALALGLSVVFALIASQTLAAVGRMPGEVMVSANGAGTYRIPLSLPPGTNGLAPELALVYDHTSGNGLLGMGWNITGLQAITRCPKNMAQDQNVITAINLTTADRFCFNGNRLRLTSGTYGATSSTYQTEIETYSRFTAYGSSGTDQGPQYFKVEQKDGLILEFGNTADSRIEATGSTAVREWALNRIRDRSYNYVDFMYTEDTTNGSYRPSEIRWTGNSAQGTGWLFRAKFIYGVSDRLDPLVRYHIGQKIKEVKRLERVEIEHNPSTLIRQYKLIYETATHTGRSRLTQIEECDGGSTCLSPSSVTWRANASGWSTTENSTSNVANTFASALILDMTGDGKDDYVWFDTSSGFWQVQPGNSSGGFDAAISTGYGSATYYNRALPADVDGDGKRDLLVPHSTGANWWWLRHSTGSTFQFADTGAPATGSLGDAWTLDADADGRDDLVWAERNAGSAIVRLRLNTTSGGTASFSGTALSAWSTAWPEERFADTEPFGNKTWLFRSASRVTDVNSDGRMDLLVSLKYDEQDGPGTLWKYYWSALISNGTSFSATGPINYSSASFTPYLADLNGDGLSDIAYYKTSSWRIRYGQGNGGFAAEVDTGQGSVNSGSPVFTDWDGDGRVDILTPGATPGTSNWVYLRSTGETLQAAADAGFASTGATFSPKVGDIDGNGLPDFIYAASTADVTRWRTHVLPVPDLAETIADGFGDQVAFTFAPLTDSAVYTPSTGAAFPVREHQSALQVVKQYVATSGAVAPEATSYTMTYAYTGARIHAQGRGFLGFAKRTSTDSRNGFYTEENFSQLVADYERLGMPTSSIVKTSSSGSTVLDTTLTWDKKELATGAEARRFPFISQSVVKNHEVGGPQAGVLISTVTTAITLDNWGTATNTTETIKEENTGDNATLTHTRQVANANIVNDTTYWCLSRAESRDWIRSHQLTGGASITRSATADFDAVECRKSWEKVAPGTAREVRTDFTYDNFGNVSQVLLTPAAASGQATRTTTYNFGTDGRFLRSITNPEAHVQLVTWDIDGGAASTRLGVPYTSTDPNSLITTLVHDSLGRPTQEVRPDGMRVETEYLACDSDCTGVTGAHHKVRLSLKKHATNSVVTERFAILDKLGREVRQTNYALAGGKVDVLTRYAAAGWVLERTQPHQSGLGGEIWTTFTNDALGRVTQASRSRTDDHDSGAHTEAISYEGLKTRFTDAAGKVSLRHHDAARNVIKVIEANGSMIQTHATYEYNAFDELLETTDKAGNSITVEYFDDRGWKKKTTDPDMGIWQYDYFPLGELKTQTDAKGQVTQFTYDKLSRPVTRVQGGLTTTWTWGTNAANKNIGRLATIGESDSNWSESYTYDSFSRLSTKTTAIDSNNYAFNYIYHGDTGLLRTVEYPNSIGTAFKVEYEHDTSNKSGLLKKVFDFYNTSTVFWQATATDAFAQPMDYTLGNSIATLVDTDQVTGAVNDIDSAFISGSAQQDLEYVWNKVGNLTSRKDNLQSGLTEAFQYDDLHRLTSAQVGAGTAQTTNYDSDGIGNLNNKSDVGTYSYIASVSACLPYPAHSQPHAVREIATSSLTYCYDANGNQSKRSGLNVTWKAYNLPETINAPGSLYATFSYDAYRQRFKQVGTAFGNASHIRTTLYVGPYEKVIDPTITRHRHSVMVNGSIVAVVSRNSDSTTETKYLTYDHLGSIDKLYDSGSTTPIAKYSFDAWGKRRAGTGWTGAAEAAQITWAWTTSARGFTGHEMLDDVGLIHMNGRVYDPRVGRFTSADPIVQAPYVTASLNRFSYVFNSPLSYTDPSGFERERPRLPNGRDNWFRPDSIGWYYSREAWLYRANAREHELAFADWQEDLMHRVREGLPPAGGAPAWGGTPFASAPLGVNSLAGEDGPTGEVIEGTCDVPPCPGSDNNRSELEEGLLIKRSPASDARTVGAVTSKTGDVVVEVAEAGFWGGLLAKVFRGFRLGKAVDDVAESGAKAVQTVPKLRRIHTAETLTSGSSRYSYEYWGKQSTPAIVNSLRPGAANPLLVRADGRIVQGNTRIYILENRGYDVNSLPRVLFDE